MDAILVGKDRQFNWRFLQMCSHYLVEPTACTPAAGWEKGQVENQVGLVRERFFTPRLHFKTLEELNAYLLDKTIAYAKAHRHPDNNADNPDRTIWQAFEEERVHLVPYPGSFDGFHCLTAAVSKTCLVRFDHNKYSVRASAVGRSVEVYAYAERIIIRQDSLVVAEHERVFGRNKTIYNPWYYVPALIRKPGALRNGASFKNWSLPTALTKLRNRLQHVSDGDKQMVSLLSCVLTDGLMAVENATQEAIEQGIFSADVIINILTRSRDPAPQETFMPPQTLRLIHEPVADCARYDRLRRNDAHGTHVTVGYDEPAPSLWDAQ